MLSTRWLPYLFLLCALFTGVRLALLTPMGQVADEPAHIARADGLLYGQLLGHRSIFVDPSTHRKQKVSGVMANQAIISASLWELAPGPPRPVSVGRLQQAKAVKWTSQLGYDISPNTVQYLPFFYLPGSIGIALAHAAGASPLRALFVGRLAMLASYLLMGFAALALAAWGRPLLFTGLTIPMALSLGASFNQDGQLIAAVCLVGALLTRDSMASPKLRLLALVIFSLVVCSKPPYGLLIFAAVLPLNAPGLLRRFGLVCLFAVPPLIWVAVMTHVSLVSYDRPAYHPGPLWPGATSIWLHSTNAADNLRVFFAHPAELVLLPAQFLYLRWNNLVHSAIGMLGWLSVPLERWQYLGWELAFVTAFIGTVFGVDGVRWRATSAGFILALILASVAAMEIALYLSWTNVGEAMIDGPSGRYYLIFIPFLILALPRAGKKIDAALGKAGIAGICEFGLVTPALVMAALDIVYLPALMKRTFHM